MDAIRVKLTTAPKAVDRIPKNVDRHKIFAQILPYLKKLTTFAPKMKISCTVVFTSLVSLLKSA